MEAAELEKALKAWNPAGFKIPWAFTRRRLAREWRMTPMAFDQVPWSEVRLELEIQAIEARATEFKNRKKK